MQCGYTAALMDLDLTKKTVLVTGASEGIGRAIAEVLAAEQMRVAVGARRKPERDAAVAEIAAATGAEVHGVALDVADDAEVRGAVDELVGRWGRLDAVVNNAGPKMKVAPIADATDDEWRAVFETKAMGFVRVARAAASAMQRGSAIVNISGITARVQVPNAGITGFVNSGVHALTAYLAAELAPVDIRVNAVCPGLIRTQGWIDRAAAMGAADGRSGDDVMAAMRDARGVLVARWGEPREVGELAAFLLSSRAAYINGQAITIDGGMRTSLS